MSRPQLRVIQGGLSLARDDVWNAELKRLKRRIERISAMRRGDASLEKVRVKGVWVKRHFRKPHDRLLIQLTGRDTRASVSTRDKKGK